MFKLFDTSYYINLKHRPLGVIEYWFSSEDNKNEANKQVNIQPEYVVNQYYAYDSNRRLQERIYSLIKGFDVETEFYVTAGIVSAGVLIGAAVCIAGPAIAAWVASAAATVSVTISYISAGITYIVYKIGETFNSIGVPAKIPGLEYN